MADAFSYFLPDGTPVTNAEAPPPPGTQYYNSSPLVPDANGALTSTADATAGNAFAGFTSAEGGGFGGYDSAVDPKTGMTFKQYDETAARNALDLGLDKFDPRSVDPSALAALQASDDDANKTKLKLAQGLPLSDAEKAHYARVRGDYEMKTFRPANYTPKTEGATPTPSKVRPVPTDAFAAFGADTLPPPDTIQTDAAILAPRIRTTPVPPPVEEGYRKFTGRTFNPGEGTGAGAPPPFSQAAWSGGEMAPSAGSGGRPSMSAGRFGRFAPMGGASPFAQKYRQRFKPLGAPANGFTPQGGGGAGGAPTTQVF